MSTVYQIFQQLRALSTPDNRQREVRAVFTAQAYAYTCDLDLSTDAHTNVEKGRAGFRTFLSQLNEYIAVDTRLSLRLFEAMVIARWEVATCHHDATLMNYILSSQTQQEQLSEDLGAVVSAMVKQREYRATQQRVKAILCEGSTGDE